MGLAGIRPMSFKESDDVQKAEIRSRTTSLSDVTPSGQFDDLYPGLVGEFQPAANEDPNIDPQLDPNQPVGRPLILVVDDELSNIRAIEAALSSEYQFQFANGGAAALEQALSDNPPDLILLDIEMPTMSGYDVCAILKSHVNARDIPIIFVTMLGQVHQEARGLELGAADYITKPIEPTILRARVRTHVRLKHRADRLESLACVDALTQLANRRGFDRYLDIEWRRAAREGADLSLLMIDVDHFKPYNDILGHASGDRCLRSVAAELQRSLRRPADFMARYGGEEFAAVLPTTDSAGASIVAETLRSKIEALGLAHPNSSTGSVVSVSVGAATLQPRAQHSSKMLVEMADRRLYEAKRNGRNRIYGGVATLRAVGGARGA